MQKLRHLARGARPWALTLLRVTIGAIMIVHGYMKLTGYDGWVDNVASMGIPLPEVMAPLAVAGELAGGVGLVLGLLTPVAALGVLSTMLVAVFFVHFDNGLLAKNGGFEYPLTLAVAALFFMIRGGGRFSLDRLIFTRSTEPSSGREPAPRWRTRDASA